MGRTNDLYRGEKVARARRVEYNRRGCRKDSAAASLPPAGEVGRELDRVRVAARRVLLAACQEIASSRRSIERRTFRGGVGSRRRIASKTSAGGAIEIRLVADLESAGIRWAGVYMEPIAVLLSWPEGRELARDFDWASDSPEREAIRRRFLASYREHRPR